jgi:nicotinamidase-related amidase
MNSMKSALTASLLSAASLVSAATQKPETLLDISGAHWPAARFSNSVLIIVDAQREYAEGRVALCGIREAVDETARLLTRAREAHTPVIHVLQHNPAPRPIFTAGTPMAEEFPALAPVAGEEVVLKSLPNSFASTTLDETLRKLGRKDLIVVGFMTHMCVSATVRSALDHGYRCTVVANACATRDLPDGHGGIVPAAEVHRAELAALADRFATVVTTEAEIER